MSDTGYPLKDALVSIRNQLWNKRSDWNIKQIYTYPIDEVGAGINSLILEILGDTQLTQTQFGAPSEFDYEIGVRITYVGAAFTAERQYHNALDMICNIWKYLMEHPQPDDYGTVKAVASMTIGGLDNASGNKVSVSSVDVMLHVTKTIAEA